MAHPLVAPLAHLLFSLQQAVVATAAGGKPADDVKALGPMSPSWRQCREILGHKGKWPSLEEIQIALAAQMGEGGTLAAPLAADAVKYACVTCGTIEKDENGVCVQCGYGNDDFFVEPTG